eukprot:TRINITY_DN975_c0_g1_i1.p1 TRINITY_DN975_c0_g1~~TRINITY_DN975_c0_g1_i1.p1  ORF type:complete len:150 (-),score=46.89 TRINITY_DN975_c0_g1_i1:92-541(-)
MATRANASAIFPNPIDDVWAAIRDFTFPGKYNATVESAEMQNGKQSDSVGGTRVVTWKSGEVEHHRLLSLDDCNFRVSWELVFAEPAAEVSAKITTVSLVRISETNETLVCWTGDFANDVTPEFLNFEQGAYLENLKELRNGLNANNNN